MKTKEEIIKQAWGEYYDDVEFHLTENGFLPYIYDVRMIRNENKIEFEHLPNSANLFRPKSLQGIENNNGWIRIESEADLPKKIIECITCFYDGENYILGDTRERNPIQLWKPFKNNQITHYKPSIKHEKPLY